MSFESELAKHPILTAERVRQLYAWRESQGIPWLLEKFKQLCLSHERLRNELAAARQKTAEGGHPTGSAR